MKNNGAKFWTIDQDTLQKLQTLKAFVDYVAKLKETSSDHKHNAQELKYLIANLDKPETFKQWCVCIDIYDPVLQCGDYGEEAEFTGRIGHSGLSWEFLKFASRKEWWIKKVIRMKRRSFMVVSTLTTTFKLRGSGVTMTIQGF
ncbi:hypothetical protein [Mangrovibacterium marinum]|uniref:Uncharacterized protein n=1 Tax=Mangrovibacterium marinum TaxID=1639118 RepID=A0A2T5BXM7_9BACT|nr:hypothetical protein [Mangrovibacterium marinum]PTN05626.1 hypothetical protein C8N47_12646 [Mangrovibacterium marinum]